MRAALIGVGQAGGRLTQAILDFDRRLGFDAVRGALAVNTAEADLRSLDVETKLIGQSTVDGNGVGGDNELGAKVMDDESTEVLAGLDDHVTTDVEALVVVAGLGGGTGSGGAPVLARELGRVYDRPVYALGILPGRDEGSLYHANAGRSLKTLAREADALLLVDNDAWRGEAESLGEAHDAINGRIARRIGLLLASGEAVEGVGENVVDSSEIINTLRNGGVASIGYASAPGADEAGENVNTVTSLARRALLTDMSLPDAVEAEAALVVIAGRPERIPRKGVESARRWIEERTGSYQVRGGDFPIDDDNLAAIVLLGGVERSDRIDRVLQRAREASVSTDSSTDPVESLRSEQLEDLF